MNDKVRMIGCVSDVAHGRVSVAWTMIEALCGNDVINSKASIFDDQLESTPIKIETCGDDKSVKVVLAAPLTVQSIYSRTMCSRTLHLNNKRYEIRNNDDDGISAKRPTAAKYYDYVDAWYAALYARVYAEGSVTLTLHT